jgi:hypothetical protein
MSLGNWNVEAYWNASTNTPKLVSGRGTNGKGYIVNTPGSTTLDGVSTWAQGDILVFVLDQWIKVGSGAGGGGGGGVVAAGAVVEATHAQMTALSFASPPDSLHTNGWATPGDWGDAFYIKVSSFPANWPTSGTITTGDGTKYIIQPRNGEFWIEQFGGQGRPYYDTTDQWQCWEDMKYCVMLQTDLGFGGTSTAAVKMRFGRGVFYVTKPMSFDNPFLVEGAGTQSNGGTTLRCPPGMDLVQFQHSFTGAGSGLTFGHEGASLNGFPRVLNSLTYVTGSTRIYKATNTGSADLGNPPTGTGTGIVSGTATFDYVREKTWAEANGYGSAFGTFRGFSLWGPGGYDNTHPTGYDEDQTQVDGGYHSGIVIKSKGVVEDCYVLSFAGHGIAVAADGDPEVRSAGNANGFIVRRCRLYYNGHAGLRIGLADANAGSYYDIDTGYNHRAGVEEFCFLGNRGFNIQDQFSGSPGNTSGKFTGGVIHNNYYWLARAPEVGADTANYANEPGTDEASWIRTDGDGTTVLSPSTNFPAWSASPGASVVYAPCGGYITNNTNAPNQVVGLYIEGGGYPPQPGNQDMMLGMALGNGVEVTRGAIGLDRGRWINGLKVNTTYVFQGAGRKTAQTYWGGQSVNNGKDAAGQTTPDNTIWAHYDWEGHQYALQYVGATAKSWQNMDMVYGDKASPVQIFGWTGSNSLQTFGRGGTNYQRNVFWVQRLILGDGSGFGVGIADRLVQMTRTHLGTGSNSASPAKDGELYIYANPSTGDPWAWHVRGGLFIPLMP